MEFSINTSYPCHVTNYAVCTSRDIKYIVIHYVGAEGSALENAKYFMNHKNLQASAHYFVGNANENGAIYQSVNDVNRAFHCGTSGIYTHKYCRNNNSIGIEMTCHKDKNGKWYFDEVTINSAIKLTRQLMKKYNVGVDNVIRHHDVWQKNCPAPFVEDENAWIKFKDRLIKEVVDGMIESWQKKLGTEAIKYLSDGKGIDLIDSPTDWESKLGDTVPNWLMFVMLQRLIEKIDK